MGLLQQGVPMVQCMYTIYNINITSNLNGTGSIFSIGTPHHTQTVPGGGQRYLLER